MTLLGPSLYHFVIAVWRVNERADDCRNAVIKELKRKGRKGEDVLREIQRYRISRGMKLKTKDAVSKVWPPK